MAHDRLLTGDWNTRIVLLDDKGDCDTECDGTHEWQTLEPSSPSDSTCCYQCCVCGDIQVLAKDLERGFLPDLER